MQMKKYKLGELMEVTRGMSLGGEFYSTKGELMRLTLGNFDYKNNCFKDDKSKDNLFFTGAVKPEFILKKRRYNYASYRAGNRASWFNRKNSLQRKIYSKSGCRSDKMQ